MTQRTSGVAVDFLSYQLGIQSGPSIVLVGAGLFTVVFAATGMRRRRLTIGLT